ncbi:M15 family metallopeptidase [Sediminibacillus halophilus]|uniref:D-alanyl-D-alanine carboxypeptidase n=1 Tax=Sediminibacillus halophilus TaxID=482461 RepID=A0A1G9UZQ3_9BACI|nr:M15 family metallopeptidase [Sediminibacillus halophilus]SDM65442.1 D-alanyl-D-alanine carboxypeptidase [Sediminibacillus halophilus]
MKKWVLLLLLVLIGFGYFYGDKTSPILHDKVKIEEKEGFRNTEKIEVGKERIYEGELLLVNEQYPVHEESVRQDIVELFNHPELTKNYGLLNNDIKLSAALAEDFSSMVQAAEQDGVNHFLISSGYRGFEEQNRLYQDMGADYALPAGKSEHNLGLSLDVGSTEAEMRIAEEGRWIEKNAWKHGFILRYPKNKTAVTGISYEPWHIRYVGLPHSAVMHDKNLALEEYLKYLKQEEKITVEVDGKTYVVCYYPISETTTIEVPVDGDYSISGDNIGGVIVTSEK